jgi:hypothetical protein
MELGRCSWIPDQVRNDEKNHGIFPVFEAIRFSQRRSRASAAPLREEEAG